MTSQAQKAEAFRALHAGEPFVLPNPWDAGSARVLAALGFKALATTSSGFAFTLGRLDGSVTLDEVVAHAAALDRATDLPLSVDLENGYGPEPESAALAIARVAAAGAVGGSIEDYDPDGRIYEAGHAVERVAAAVRGRPRARLPVHADRPGREPHPRQPRPRRHDRAPAGLRGGRRGRALCPRAAQRARRSGRCATPSRSPVNVLALPELSLAEIVEAGARRISVGGGLTWVAVGRWPPRPRRSATPATSPRSRARLPLGDWLAA